jgi:hypothetical protein
VKPARSSDALAKRVADHVSKYMEVLQVAGPRPRVELVSGTAANWAARTDQDPPTTLIELRAKLFSDSDKFLERVVAHEMIHHRNYLAGAEDEQHGPAFREGADRINAIMGRGFVVERITPPDAGIGLAKALLAIGIGGLAAIATIKTAVSLRPTLPDNERGHYG